MERSNLQAGISALGKNSASKKPKKPHADTNIISMHKVVGTKRDDKRSKTDMTNTEQHNARVLENYRQLAEEQQKDFDGFEEYSRSIEEFSLMSRTDKNDSETTDDATSKIELEYRIRTNELKLSSSERTRKALKNQNALLEKELSEMRSKYEALQRESIESENAQIDHINELEAMLQDVTHAFELKSMQFEALIEDYRSANIAQLSKDEVDTKK